MTPYEIGQALGGLVSGVLGLLFVLAFFTAVFFWPLMAWSVMRNIKLIRLQLERLNDTIEGRAGAARRETLGL